MNSDRQDEVNPNIQTAPRPNAHPINQINSNDRSGVSKDRNKSVAGDPFSNPFSVKKDLTKASIPTIKFGEAEYGNNQYQKNVQPVTTSLGLANNPFVRQKQGEAV